jgi:hypothetical protein
MLGCVMRYVASYIKSIYARYASLTVHYFLIYYAIFRIICERILGYVIEDTYNDYLTLFIIIFYKLRNFLLFLKTFTTFYFPKNL